jgi:hypothetical protein
MMAATRMMMMMMMMMMSHAARAALGELLPLILTVPTVWRGLQIIIHTSYFSCIRQYAGGVLDILLAHGEAASSRDRSITIDRKNVSVAGVEEELIDLQ